MQIGGCASPAVAGEESPRVECVANALQIKNGPTYAWDDPARTEFKPLPPGYIATGDKAGWVNVTLGGSSVTGNFRGLHGTLKLFYPEEKSAAIRGKPRTPEELANVIVDVIAPELRAQAKAGRYANGDSPLITIPTPGAVQDERIVFFPKKNFGPLADPHGVDLEHYVRSALAIRASETGLGAAQLLRSKVWVMNDIGPVAAAAIDAHAGLIHPGENGFVLFGGTGTGGGNVEVGENNSLTTLRADEQGHIRVADFKSLLSEFPRAIRLGSIVANAPRKLEAAEVSGVPRWLELEHLSAGGNGGAHLSGADAVIVRAFLPGFKGWVKERVSGTDLELDRLQKDLIHSLGYAYESEGAITGALAAAAPEHGSALKEDLRLIDRLKSKGFLLVKDVAEAAERGRVWLGSWSPPIPKARESRLESWV